MSHTDSYPLNNGRDIHGAHNNVNTVAHRYIHHDVRLVMVVRFNNHTKPLPVGREVSMTHTTSTPSVKHKISNILYLQHLFPDDKMDFDLQPP